VKFRFDGIHMYVKALVKSDNLPQHDEYASFGMEGRKDVDTIYRHFLSLQWSRYNLIVSHHILSSQPACMGF